MKNNTTTAKILIVGPSWVGDMVMSQSLAMLLAKCYPNVIIDVLAPNVCGALVTRMPQVRKHITMPVGHGKLQLWQRYQLARQLKAEKYQQAIILPNSFKSALIPFLARIPIRTGWRGEMRYGLLNDLRVLDKQALPLMIQRFIALGLKKNATLPQTLPWPSLMVPSQAAVACAQRHVQKGTRAVVALCPGAEFGPAKQWPAQHYIAVANTLVERGYDIWIFGGPNDVNLTHMIADAVGDHVTDLGGKTSLVDAIDLLSLTDVVITNDSGLMHVAAALNKKLVVIYGSTDPNFTPPLCKQVKILRLGLDCSPCFERVCPLGHLRCLRDLKPQLVLDALSALMRPSETGNCLISVKLSHY